VGLKIAERTAERLGLPGHEAEALKFLVHKHLRMNHLAFRRDTSDEDLVVHFAVQVGSPSAAMMYILTAADIAARPRHAEQWKLELITDLYHRTMDIWS
jgi:[protein-PII] uridylyltransferase